MKGTVIGIESGTKYQHLDGRRRIEIRIDGADVPFQSIRISERALGIIGLKLDDPVEVAFGGDAVAIRAERAKSKQEGGVS